MMIQSFQQVLKIWMKGNLYLEVGFRLYRKLCNSFPHKFKAPYRRCQPTLPRSPGSAGGAQREVTMYLVLLLESRSEVGVSRHLSLGYNSHGWKEKWFSISQVMNFLSLKSFPSNGIGQAEILIFFELLKNFSVRKNISLSIFNFNLNVGRAFCISEQIFYQ